MAGLCLGFSVGIMFVNLVLREHSQMYKEGLEAGKLYVRNAMLQQNDSLINSRKEDAVAGCSVLGYIPDTISVKLELKNGGSYKIDKGK